MCAQETTDTELSRAPGSAQAIAFGTNYRCLRVEGISERTIVNARKVKELKLGAFHVEQRFGLSSPCAHAQLRMKPRPLLVPSSSGAKDGSLCEASSGK